MVTEWRKIKTAGTLPAYPSLKSRISGFTYFQESKYLQLCLTPNGDKWVYWVHGISEWEFVSVLLPSWYKGLHGTFFSYLQHPDFPPFGVHQRLPGSLDADWETFGDLVRLKISLPWRECHLQLQSLHGDGTCPARAIQTWSHCIPKRGGEPLVLFQHRPLKELLLLSRLSRNRKEAKTGEVTRVIWVFQGLCLHTASTNSCWTHRNISWKMQKNIQSTAQCSCGILEMSDTQQYHILLVLPRVLGSAAIVWNITCPLIKKP